MKAGSSIATAAVASVLLLFSPAVSAHGFVESINLGGKTVATTPGPYFKPDGNGPAATISSINDASLVCGKGTVTPTDMPEVAAGAKIDFQWSKSWPHQKGPIFTYMGSFEPGSDPSSVKFFKIDEQTLIDDKGTWAQSKVAAGSPVSATMPADLKPGNYLIRHELVNLGSIPGEFYPACIQVKVTGSGSNVPSDTVSFPGAYKADQFPQDVYSIKTAADFKSPPPAVLGGAAAPPPSRRNMLSRPMGNA